MSVQATKRLEELLASRINAAGAHCGGDRPKPQPKPPGV
jgi:hypothetical protein